MGIRATRTWFMVKSALWLAFATCMMKGAMLPDPGIAPRAIEGLIDGAGMVMGVWIVVREMPKWR